MLNGLCEKTEPASPSNTQLFSEHAISVQEMLKEVRDLHTGRQAINPDSERDLMINIMRQANKIWKFRKKWEEIKKTGKDFNKFHDEQLMMQEIEDYLAQGQKINAIKHYREKMKEIYGEKLGLRECKEYIDSIK